MKISQILNEYKIPISFENGDTLVEYGDTLYNYTKNPTPFLEKMVDSGYLDSSTLDDNIDIDDLFNEINISQEECFYATIVDDSLYIDGNSFEVSLDDKRIPKIMRQLGIEYVIFDFDDILDNTNNYFKYAKEEFHKKFEDKTFYHGTDLKHWKNIFRKGISPNKTTNFENINHDDKIFMSRNMKSAVWHSLTKSFPMILEFKVPDYNKIITDYDIALNKLGKSDDTTIKLGYRDIINVNNWDEAYKDIVNLNIDGSELSKARQHSRVNSTYGIYGYVGRIPSNFITHIATTENIITAFVLKTFFDVGDAGGAVENEEYDLYTPKRLNDEIERIKNEIEAERYLNDDD